MNTYYKTIRAREVTQEGKGRDFEKVLTRKLGKAIVWLCQENLAKEIDMTREEILEKSQNENKGKDVVEEEFVRKGFLVCWLVSLAAASIVALTEAIVLGKQNSGLFFALMSGLFSFFLMKYIKLRKRHELFISIAYGIAAVCFAISWIITLVK
jgi:hypothetical protein